MTRKKEAVKENVLRILNEKYGVEEEDFLLQSLRSFQLARLVTGS